MKKYLALFFLISLLVVMSCSSSVSLFSNSVITTFSYIILPTLAPSILLDYLFINVGGLEYIYILLKKHTKNHHQIYRHLIVMLGLISGTPTLANYINDSINKGYLSLKEGQVIMNSFLLPSFPFIIGLIVPKLSSFQSITLLTLLYVPSLIYYFFSLRKENNDIPIAFNEFNNAFIKESISSTASTLILLLGTILLFSLPMPFFKMFLKENLAYYLLGICEFTSSSLYIVNHLNSLSFIILISILSFSSLSLYVQANLLCPKINIAQIIKKRLLFLGINLTIIFGLLLFKIL